MTFALPLFLAGLIFLAAGLVLPTGQGEYPSDLRIYFEQNGKWAIAALAARGIVAISANKFLINNSFTIGIVDILIMIQVVVSLLFIFSKKRKFQVTLTLLFGLVLFLTATLIILLKYK